MNKVENERVNKTDDNNNNKPIRDRHTTDIVFCFIMLGFWVACIFTGIYGLEYGDPNVLQTIYDRNGTPCGNEASGT